MRPDDVNVPLTIHVLGAGLLVGTLLVVATAILLGWRSKGDEGDAVGLTRLGLRTLLMGVFPAYLVMRVGAQWTEAAEDLPEIVEDSAWIGIGYITADIGAVLIIISMILSGIGLRKLRSGGGLGLGRAVGIISLLLVAAYVVAVWAMAGKPQ
jgi:hypothetical protein